MLSTFLQFVLNLADMLVDIVGSYCLNLRISWVHVCLWYISSTHMLVCYCYYVLAMFHGKLCKSIVSICIVGGEIHSLLKASFDERFAFKETKQVIRVQKLVGLPPPALELLGRLS